MSILTIELDKETKQRLEELSSGTGLSPAELTQEAVQSYLEEIKETKEAEEVLGRIKRGEEGTITLEEWEKSLDLEG